MRILMLAQFYPPVIGGEERMVQDLSVELAQRGHDVAVATLWHEGLPVAEVDRGVRIYRIRSLTQRAAWLFAETGRRHAPPWPDPEALWGLRRVLAEHRPMIVHAHNWLLHSFLPLARRSRARLVVTLHDYSLVCAKKRLMLRGQPCSGPAMLKCLGCAAEHYGVVKGTATALAQRAMLGPERSAVDMFLPISQAVAAGSGLTGSRWPYQVIPNFVPDALGRPQLVEAGYLDQLPSDGFIMYAGDLSPDKGVDVLLRAYAGLSGVPPLVLIGRRPHGRELMRVPNTFVLDSWPHAAVMEAWRRCSAAVVPSIWAEPFGLVALEAMAAGRPVIASRSGGLADIVVDGETGLLVPPGDVEALRAAMSRLAASPDLASRLGQGAQRRIASFRASAVIPQVEQVYHAVLKAARPARRPRSRLQAGLGPAGHV